MRGLQQVMRAGSQATRSSVGVETTATRPEARSEHTCSTPAVYPLEECCRTQHTSVTQALWARTGNPDELPDTLVTGRTSP